MKVLMLGSGAADIHAPRMCNCENCSAVKQRGGHSVRTFTSVLIDDELLVDCGRTVPAQIRKLDAGARVTSVLITHTDSDHMDPIALAELPTDPTQYELPVYGSNDVVSKLRYEAQSQLDLHVLKPFERSNVNGYDVEPLPARHRSVPGAALLFVISREDEHLFFACDTGPLPQDTLEALGDKQLDIVIAEATFGLKTENTADLETAHMNFPMVCELRQDLLKRGVIGEETPFIATHLSLHHCPPHEASAEWLRERGVILGFDGMVLDRQGDPSSREG